MARENRDFRPALKEALESAGRIGDEFNRSWAIKNISVRLAETGEFEEAIKIAREIKNDFHRGTALREIALKLAEDGKPFDHILREAEGYLSY